jgi:hypothetical protein
MAATGFRSSASPRLPWLRLHKTPGPVRSSRQGSLAEFSGVKLGTPRPYPSPAMGNPASFQAATPPLSALALTYPASLKAAA